MQVNNPPNLMRPRSRISARNHNDSGVVPILAAALRVQVTPENI